MINGVCVFIKINEHLTVYFSWNQMICYLCQQYEFGWANRLATWFASNTKKKMCSHYFAWLSSDLKNEINDTKCCIFCLGYQLSESERLKAQRPNDRWQFLALSFNEIKSNLFASHVCARMDIRTNHTTHNGVSLKIKSSYLETPKIKYKF